MGKKTLVLVVCCLMVVFMGTGTGFTTRANALADEVEVEQEIQPRFGGKSYASAKFVNSAGQCNGLTLYVKAYAENYVWPMADRGHAYVLVNYNSADREVDAMSGYIATVNVSMQYDWGDDLGGIQSSTYSVEYQGYFLNQDFPDPDDYPYTHEMTSLCSSYNGTGNSKSSCYCIWVNVTATYPGGFTASVSRLVSTF